MGRHEEKMVMMVMVMSMITMVTVLALAQTRLFVSAKTLASG
jgi:hypothetical protein